MNKYLLTNCVSSLHKQFILLENPVLVELLTEFPKFYLFSSYLAHNIVGSGIVHQIGTVELL